MAKPKRMVKRPRKRSNSNRKVSLTLKAAIKQVVTRQVETKTINVPDATTGTTNTVGLVYPSGSGLQYLCQDVFRVKQGVTDSTVIGSLNRIGDKIKGIGFLMDYYFHTYSQFSIGAFFYQVPYLKLRITVWKQAFGSPLLTAPLLYDTNFLNVATSTLQPINFDEGYVKDILYDRVHVIKSTMVDLSIPTYSQYPCNTVFHFKKYFKYDQFIKFTDNNTISPNSTDKPIYITMSAEVDDANVFVPSGVRLVNTTGYTRAWFKDA